MSSLVEPASEAIDPADRFDDLFRRYYSELSGLAYRLLGDRADVEETVQETFLRLSGAAVIERPDAEVGAWLRRVCLNLGANRLRDRRRARDRLERAGRLNAAVPPSDLDDPARSVLRQEARDAVRRTLARLPDRQRDCLLLRHAGYSYAEIAATLGIAVGSVGVILARAEHAFRKFHEERDDDLS